MFGRRSRPVPLLALLLLQWWARPATAQSCADQHQHCAFWAERGECANNPDWMLANCKRACKQCPAEPAAAAAAAPSDASPAPARPADPDCPRVQLKEVQTRFVPTDAQFRQQVQSAGCAVPNQLNICSRNSCYHKLFRTMDGSCNHEQDAMKGAAYTPYVRLLDADYEDGIGKMVSNRPNPRTVTHRLITSSVALPTDKSGMMTAFAQFLMHDITKNTLINVCNCGVNGRECANILPDRGDKRTACVPFTRSTSMCMTGVQGRPRLPVNENTAFIDCSAVYGSDPSTADSIRVGAFLKSALTNVRDVMPPSQSEHFETGDDRANLFVGLLALHSVFLRLHNRIATQLSQLNPTWPVDRVYQETRKIQGAIVQAIVYNELVPAFLGGKSVLLGAYQGFKEDVDPGIAVEFAGSAARLHGLVQENYPFVNEQFQVVGTYTTLSAAGSSTPLRTHGAALILRGLISSAARKPGRISTSMTEFLFGSTTDMASMNVQRGRDLGLRNYNAYRTMCGLAALRSLDEWAEVSDPNVRRRVADLYAHPDQIDFYVGGLLEEPRQNAVVGPTFACVFADQLKRLRDGDRFFYKNAGVFSDAQRDALDRVTLARVFCDTADFSRVQPNVFEHDAEGQKAVSCSQIAQLDLNPWRE